MTHRIVYAGPYGPSFFEFRDERELIATLMCWRQIGSTERTATLWKRLRTAWVPAFPWQHGERV